MSLTLADLRQNQKQIIRQDAGDPKAEWEGTRLAGGHFNTPWTYDLEYFTNGHEGGASHAETDCEYSVLLLR